MKVGRSVGLAVTVAVAVGDIASVAVMVGLSCGAAVNARATVGVTTGAAVTVAEGVITLEVARAVGVAVDLVTVGAEAVSVARDERYCPNPASCSSVGTGTHPDSKVSRITKSGRTERTPMFTSSPDTCKLFYRFAA